MDPLTICIGLVGIGMTAQAIAHAWKPESLWKRDWQKEARHNELLTERIRELEHELEAAKADLLPGARRTK